MTIQNKIDHIVIGADSLEQGIASLEASLGVTLPKASKHEAMSTHNAVAPVGNESFIEVLAIDPEAPNPGRARWFDMDNPQVQARFKDSAQSYHWVVGTSDLNAVVENSSIDLGEIVTFTRGERSWRLTIPKDGSLSEQGLIPTFIEWSPGAHPSTGMKDLGITLNRVVLTHPDPASLQQKLDELGVSHLASVLAGDTAGIAFEMQNDQGDIVLL
ncbi:VOC family protein [Marinomonas algarum]|uniref:VOC family protein n=1 Tax=Marinomonas algarum TaxID=2883105 RepID=A0A9X1LEC5_9GAMM|nr:VOC family protein [Marinomonas algarum]MCB5160915.1 VOC family protein [Marinomonas algarum]